MKTRSFSTLLTSLAVFALVSAGCDSASTSPGNVAGGDDSERQAGDAPDKRGHLILKLTDNPFPFDDAESANVTITRVELIGHDSTDVDTTDQDSGPHRVVLSDSPQTFNLLALRDGVTATVGDIPLPEGTWTQARFIVSEDASVVMKDSTVFSLKVPSGPQTGIKVNIGEIDLSAAEDTAIVTVDFDVEDSFVVMGNPSTPAGIKGFLFKPVLKIASIEINGEPLGSIDGTVFSTPLEAVTLERQDN